MAVSTPKTRAIVHRNSLIEHMAAKGVDLATIAKEVGLKSETVSKLLRTPESVARVEAINEEIRSLIVTEAANLGQEFDRAAPGAFETMVRLNNGVTEDIMNPVPHAVRLNAATQILDRAPSAPTRTGERGEGDQHLHIHLPEKQFKNAQQALIDIGVAPEPAKLEEDD